MINPEKNINIKQELPKIIEEFTLPEKTKELISSEIALCRGTGKENDCPSYHQVENEKSVDQRLVDFLYLYFIKKHYKIIITSGYRCPRHNEFSVKDDKSGMTKKDSLHTKAQAVDFRLLDKNNNPQKYEDYQNIIQSINSDYKFSKDDWAKIYETSDQDYLSKENNNIMFLKAYDTKEGRDTDNKHIYAYIHLDFRTIDKNHPIAKKYYEQFRQE